jgi:hypothetical protein
MIRPKTQVAEAGNDRVLHTAIFYAVRENVARLQARGMSVGEGIAAKPTGRYDAKKDFQPQRGCRMAR